jgi:hypothetical protein
MLSIVSSEASFPPGGFVNASREKSNLIGWRQTLTTSSPNHILLLACSREKIAKWKVLYYLYVVLNYL